MTLSEKAELKRGMCLPTREHGLSKLIFFLVSVPVLDISAVIDGDAELPCDITPPGG